MGFAVKINTQAYSEAEKLTCKVLGLPCFLIQYGRQMDIWANANIDFLTPYTKKMYRLANPKKIPTEVKIGQ